MKIMILVEWFSEKMGYAENYLPVALGKLGHEVHAVTTDFQVYGTTHDYDEIYLRHLGPKQVEKGIFKKEVFTLHRNPHEFTNGLLGIADLENKIEVIRPDIVYCFEILGPDYERAIHLMDKYKYKLFAESRIHLSVFNKPKTLVEKVKFFKQAVKGRTLSKHVSLFYPVAPDVLKVITTYYGIPKRKCQIASLAVDTDLFCKSVSSEQSKAFRKKHGYSDEEIVCLYTGRFTDSKGPLILAQAIDYLHEIGETRFKGLFVGQGDLSYETGISNLKGCTIHPFVQANELPSFYQSFDIGVWPLQESTSQLDAASCGMPIIINNRVEDSFRTEGNGLKYRDGDYKDLAIQILSLESKEKRKQMGDLGNKKILAKYSWEFLAKSKLQDFKKS